MVYDSSAKVYDLPAIETPRLFGALVAEPSQAIRLRTNLILQLNNM